MAPSFGQARASGRPSYCEAVRHGLKPRPPYGLPARDAISRLRTASDGQGQCGTA